MTSVETEGSPPPAGETEPDRASAEALLSPSPSATAEAASEPTGFSTHRAWLGKLADPVAILALLAVIMVSFRDALFSGVVAYEADTLRFYYPLERWFAEQFKSGHFPLWNPYIFAGYPIFGDGELGFAYPIHLLMLTFLSGDQTYVWLRISTGLVGALGMFALCRALRLGPLPALIGGITFSLGSFLPAQAHHEDMTRSVAWTPLAMAFVEWGLRTRGWARFARFTGAAVAVAMSGLGLHPQGLAISLLATSSFIATRILLGRSLWVGESRWGRFRHAIGTLGKRTGITAGTGFYVVGLGLALAAVQLIPVGERGAATFRASQPDYGFATSYAFPPLNLVDLLFPYFYRGADSQYWSLWSQWETTLYVGILPLALGVIGIIRALRGPAAYFLALSAGGLWLAFASYVPLDLYRLLWSLPGFSAFRVPGRYSFLFVLGWAVLAAYGAHALGSPTGWSRRRVAAAGGALVVAIGVTAGLALGIETLREQILVHQLGANEIIQDYYLALRHHQEGIPREQVFAGLTHTLDLTTPRTALGVLFVALTGLTLAATILRGSIAGGFQAVLATVAALDLLIFTSGLHYVLPVQDLAASSPAAQFLTEHADQGRIFVPFPAPLVESNRLVPLGVEDLGGYSSLESRRNFSYWSQLTGTPNLLMDLANVRYLVLPAKRSTQPSFDEVSFDPERPLLVGSLGSVGGSDSWAFSGHRVTQVRVVGALTHAFTIPQDAVVAEVRLIPATGNPVVVPLRAGVDLAEWAYDRPDAIGKVTHNRPPTVAYHRPDFDPVLNANYELHLWYSSHNLPVAIDVDRVEIRYVYPRGSMEIHGLALFDDESRTLEVASQRSRTKLKPTYRDADVDIYESTATFPKAYLVPNGVLTDPEMEGRRGDPISGLRPAHDHRAGWCRSERSGAGQRRPDAYDRGARGPHSDSGNERRGDLSGRQQWRWLPVPIRNLHAGVARLGRRRRAAGAPGELPLSGRPYPRGLSHRRVQI
jgi:hypothetical protein